VNMRRLQKLHPQSLIVQIWSDVILYADPTGCIAITK
jgi:hypothetical protein